MTSELPLVTRRGNIRQGQYAVELMRNMFLKDAAYQQGVCISHRFRECFISAAACAIDFDMMVCDLLTRRR